MDNRKYANEELDNILDDIKKNKYKGEIKPELVYVGPDKESVSIPIENGAKRRVFERDKHGNWEEIPYVGQNILG